MKNFSKHILSVILLIVLFSCSTAREQVASGNTQDEERTGRREITEQERLESTAMLIEGIQQKILGNTDRAKAMFINATEKDPENDAAHFELAKIYTEEGDYENAHSSINKAISLDPSNNEYQLVLSDIYILQDDLPSAVKIYEGLAREHPENVELQRNLVSAYLHTERYNDAISVLEHIESLTGFSKEISVQKLRIWVNQGDYDKAITEAEKMIEYFPEESMFYELLGELYMETGRDDEARDIYLGLLEHEPDSHVARLLLADYYHQSGQEEEAFAQLKEAFNSPGLGIEAKGRIVYSYMRRAEEDPDYLEKAIELSGIILETHQEDPEAYLIYGDLLYTGNELEQARDMYLKGVRLDPSNLQVWQQILSLDLRLGEYENMLSHSDMALEYFFEQPILFLFNGLANMQLKDYEAAASSLEYGLMMTVSDDDLRQDFLTMLGDVYFKLGAPEESYKYYEEALELDPHSATTLNNYSYHLALEKKRLDEALEMSARSIEAEPDNAAFLDTYGWIKYQMGEYNEARQWIRRAIEASEEPSAAILEHYGDVLYKLGDAENALIYWEKAAEAGNGSEFLDKKIRDRTLYE